MSPSKKLILAGLILGLVSLSACKKAGVEEEAIGRLKGRAFSVNIYTYPPHSGNCYADNNVVTLWKDQGQMVSWIPDKGNAYFVDFTAGTNNPPPGTPFVENGHPKPTFPVPAGGHVESGVPTGSGYYAYAIKNAQGNVCKQATDPGVYVRP